MKKKANVVMLPAKPNEAKLLKNIICFDTEQKNEITIVSYPHPIRMKPQHLYFTEKCEVLKNEYSLFEGELVKNLGKYLPQDSCVTLEFNNGVKISVHEDNLEEKIIATTNPELWKDGIPKIGLDFVHQFLNTYNVKNDDSNQINEVMLEYFEGDKYFEGDNLSFGRINGFYKWIRPFNEFTGAYEWQQVNKEEFEINKHIKIQILKQRSNGTVIIYPVELRKYTQEEVISILENYDREFKLDTFAYTKPCEYSVSEWFNKKYK